MDAATRRKHIVERLISQKTISVKDIRDEFSVSLPTVRNDLDFLEQSGVVIRTFGGAILNTQAEDEHKNGHDALWYSARITRNRGSKEKIGKLAAELVSPLDVIFLDAGTTVYQMLKEIESVDNLAVLTNSIHVCTHLMDVSRITHYLMGGAVKPISFATIGLETVKNIKENKVNKVFLGADGLSNDYFTVQDVNEAITKQAMMDIATEKYLLVDTSKINKPTFVDVAKFTTLDAIITENGIYDIKGRDVETLSSILNLDL